MRASGSLAESARQEPLQVEGGELGGKMHDHGGRAQAAEVEVEVGVDGDQVADVDARLSCPVGAAGSQL